MPAVLKNYSVNNWVWRNEWSGCFSLLYINCSKASRKRKKERKKEREEAFLISWAHRGGRADMTVVQVWNASSLRCWKEGRSAIWWPCLFSWQSHGDAEAPPPKALAHCGLGEPGAAGFQQDAPERVVRWRNWRPVPTCQPHVPLGSGSFFLPRRKQGQRHG